MKSAARRNDADFSFRARPLDYTGAITRAITARNQPTRSAERLHPVYEGIAACTTTLLVEGSHESRMGQVLPARIPSSLSSGATLCSRCSCALNPFYSAMRTYAVLMRKSDVLAGPLLFLVAARAPSALSASL